jgi:hypothetical protein
MNYFGSDLGTEAVFFFRELSVSSIRYLITQFMIFFRMYPVIIGNGRSLQSDTVIGGYRIPKGVRYL